MPSSSDVERGTLGVPSGGGGVNQDVTERHSPSNSIEESSSGDSESKTTTKYGAATVAPTSDGDVYDEDAHHDKFPVREVRHDFSFFSDICAYNPVVSGIAIVVLWGVSLWCMGKLFEKQTMA